MSHLLLSMTVNGEPVQVAAPAHHTLLEVLRYKLDLIGTKQCAVVFQQKAHAYQQLGNVQQFTNHQNAKVGAIYAAVTEESNQTVTADDEAENGAGVGKAVVDEDEVHRWKLPNGR